MCIKFYQKLGKTCTETHNMIKIAFREDSMSCTQVFEWCRCFREGNKYPGWPLTSRNNVMIDIVHDLLKSDGRLVMCKASWVRFSRSNSKYGILYTILQHLQDVVHRKWPKMWSSGNWQIHHNTIVSTIKLLNKQDKTIVFQWIPSHVGIRGNETADLLAKKGTTLLSKRTTLNFETIKRCNA